MTSQRALAIRIAYEVVEWQAGRSCGTDPATGDFHVAGGPTTSWQARDVVVILVDILGTGFSVRFDKQVNRIVVERAR